MKEATWGPVTLTQPESLTCLSFVMNSIMSVAAIPPGGVVEDACMALLRQGRATDALFAKRGWFGYKSLSNANRQA